MSRQSLLDSVQGFAARHLQAIPDRAHNWIAKWLKQDHYPELEPSLKTLMAVRNLRRRKKELIHNPVKNRERFAREMVKISPNPTKVGSVEDSAFKGPEGDIKTRLYRPEAHNAVPVLMVFMHGGGFVAGDLNTHDEACRMLCYHGQFHVLSIDYRLAPEHPFPAAYYDTVAAITWAHEQREIWGLKNVPVVVCGDSAGGTLAACASGGLKETEYRPFAQLLLYPAIDFHMSTYSKYHYRDHLIFSGHDLAADYYRYNPDERYSPQDPRLAPLQYDDLSNLPTTLVITAELDILRDEGELYARRLSGSGVESYFQRISGLMHGFINMTTINLSARRAVIQAAKDFRLLVDRQLAQKTNL